jgi:hypothetical protein
MKILVPVDGSDQALAAVRHALRLRREGLNASFVLVTVQEPTDLHERVLAPDAAVLEHVTGALGSRARAGAEALFDAAEVADEREIGACRRTRYRPGGACSRNDQMVPENGAPLPKPTVKRLRITVRAAQNEIPWLSCTPRPHRAANLEEEESCVTFTLR